MRGKLYRPAQAVSGARITPADAGKTLSWRNNPLPSRHHPRGCGENLLRFTVRRADIGSPPQVRGKRVPPQYLHVFRRITPAGAGKTTARIPIAASPRDHPRRCGENWRTYDSGPYAAWITPAGAGKTPPTPKPARLQKDHPRRCGENRLCRFLCVLNTGSPPQVRGKLIFIQIIKPWHGITPAGAGKTNMKYDIIDFIRDHPRRCGENQ